MVFNNRELAVLIWGLILLVAILLHQITRNIIADFLKVMYANLTSKVMLKVNGLLVSYVLFIVYLLSELGIFDCTQLKNTLIWFFSIALIPLFKLEKFSESPKKYKEYCFASFEILAVIQFLVGLYTFSFIVEMVHIPVITFFTLIYAFIETRKEYKNEVKLKSFFTNIFLIYGFVLIGHTIYMAAIDYDGFASWRNLQDFLVPVLLTIMYLPFVYFLVTYSCYERAFIRIDSKFQDYKLKSFTKSYVLYKFNFNYMLLKKWLISLSLHTIETKGDVKQSVFEIIRLNDFEKNPPSIATNKGWSPYEAMNFLSKLGIKAKNYHHLYDDEWMASSDFIDTSEEYEYKNKIVYYVTGDSGIAKSLRLELIIAWIDKLEVGHNQLLAYASELINIALDRDIKPEIENAILSGESSVFNIGRYQVVLTKENWGNKELNGYNLTFEIKLADSGGGYSGRN